MMFSPAIARRSRTCLFVAANLITVCCLSRGEVFVSDDFSLDGKERIVGAALNKMPAQKGFASWSVPGNSSAVFSGEGAISASTDRPTCQALIAIQDPVSKIVVQADVITQGSGWVGLGFQTSALATWFTPGNLIFVNLSPSGAWTLYRDQGGLTALASGTLDNFVPERKYTLALQYDPATSLANVLVNGADVSGTIDTSLPISTEIGAAGFLIYPGAIPSESAKVDNFQVMDAKD